MDGFEEKIGQILSNPEALAKVMEMAKSFQAPSGGEGGGFGGETPPAVSAALPEGLTPAESMPDLAAMLSGLNPGALGGILNLAGELNRPDDRRSLLLKAIKPYVRSERQGKLDRAIEIVRLAKLAKAGLGLLGGGENSV